MNRALKSVKIGNVLDKLYPTTPVPLEHKDPYTLLVAVMLSAQTTDKKVNQVTPSLFKKADSPEKMAMIGYILNNTLSDHGTVNRGVCSVDENNFLIEVNERVKLAMQDGVIKYNLGSDDPVGEVEANASVSMNYWGFHPSIFDHIEKGLVSFMKENSQNPTAEYYIPDIVTSMIVSNKMEVEVIPTNDNWFGVTYKEDRQMAVDSISKHIASGVYPNKLWS